jgi:hypothetical protein
MDDMDEEKIQAAFKALIAFYSGKLDELRDSGDLTQREFLAVAMMGSAAIFESMIDSVLKTHEKHKNDPAIIRSFFRVYQAFGTKKAIDMLTALYELTEVEKTN